MLTRSITKKCMEQDKQNIERLDWDSQHFSLTIGKFSIASEEDISFIPKLNHLAGEGNYDLVYVFSDFNLSSKKVITEGLKLVDKKVVFTKSISCLESQKLDLSYLHSYSGDGNNIRLESIAFESGKYSRFKIDNKFPAGSFESMYSLWLSRSIKRIIADDVIVYIYKDEILGLLTYKIHNDVCVIGLIGVYPKSQNRMIGTHLIAKLEFDLKNKGINKIEVATQLDNEIACRFYKKNYFKIKEIKYIYHLWI